MMKLIPMFVAATLALGGLRGASAQDTKPAEKGDSEGLHPIVKMETTLGTITLQLDAEKAPITVKNFIQYAEDGFYNDTIFHRVIADFMVQGGGYSVSLDEKKQGLRDPIRNEWRTGLKNEKGVISMARLGPPAPNSADSATAQFFINVVDNSRLDQPQGDGAAYCGFGRVTEGMDVVEKIRTAKVERNEKYPGGPVVPAEPILIKSVKVVSGWDAKKADERVKAALEAAKAAVAAAEAEKMKAVEATIQKIEQETGKKMERSASGLMWVILKEGSGDSPKPTSRVTVHYTGWLTDGKKFDSSVDRGEPTAFGLNQVIRGWTEGVGMMKAGEKRKLLIPPDLGYGPRGTPGGPIPPNAWLIFDVELLSFD